MQYVSRVRKEDAHDDGIWSVAWSANGQIVTGSCDEVVQTYMVHGQQIEKKHELRGHHLGVTSVSVSAEGNLAASSALDSHIRLWDLEKGEEVRTIDAGPVEAWTVAVSPDGATVASGSQGGNVNLWSVGSGEKAATLQGSGKFTMSVAYSADGKYVASGHADGAVCVFDAEKEKLVHKLAGARWPSARSPSRATARSSSAAPTTATPTCTTSSRARRWRRSRATRRGSSASRSPPTTPTSPGAPRPLGAHVVDGKAPVPQTFADAHADQAWGVAFDSERRPLRLGGRRQGGARVRGDDGAERGVGRHCVIFAASPSFGWLVAFWAPPRRRLGGGYAEAMRLLASCAGAKSCSTPTQAPAPAPRRRRRIAPPPSGTAHELRHRRHS